jgi:hypothetical protein
MRDDARRPVEADQPKAASFTSLADFLGIKAAKPIGFEPVGDAPNQSGLADARLPGHQQDVGCIPAGSRH